MPGDPGGASLNNLTSGLADALSIIFVLRTLALNETTLGLIFCVGAIGGLLGAVTAEAFARWVGEDRSIPLAALLMPIAGISTPWPRCFRLSRRSSSADSSARGAVVVYNIAKVSADGLRGRRGLRG